MYDFIITIKTMDRLMCAKNLGYKKSSSSESTYDETFTFSSGKIYGLIGEIGSGGGAISYLLSGKEVVQNETLMIDGKRIKPNKVFKEGWYVGEGIQSKFKIISNAKVERQIKIGLVSGKTRRRLEFNVMKITDKFGLDKNDIKSRFNKLEWSQWKASLAIGYAHGKRVFCFPFLNTAALEDIILNTNLPIYLDKLKKEGACIIIPTSKAETIELIADETILLNNPRYDNQKYLDMVTHTW